MSKLVEAKYAKVAAQMLKLLLTLETAEERLNAVALVANAWIEHKSVKGEPR